MNKNRDIVIFGVGDAMVDCKVYAVAEISKDDVSVNTIKENVEKMRIKNSSIWNFFMVDQTTDVWSKYCMAKTRDNDKAWKAFLDILEGRAIRVSL